MNLRAFSSSTIFFFSRLEELRLLQKLLFFWFQVFLGFVFGKTTLLEYLHKSLDHLNLLGVFVLWSWVVIVQKHGSLSAPRNSILDRLFGCFFLLLSRQPVFFLLLLDFLGTLINALTQQTLYGCFQLKTWELWQLLTLSCFFLRSASSVFSCSSSFLWDSISSLRLCWLRAIALVLLGCLTGLSEELGRVDFLAPVLNFWIWGAASFT